MKLGLKALVIAMVMALAAIPAASAGNGHGGGKPSWAGGGKPSWAGGGKPSWAGSGHATTNAPHEKKPKKDKVKHHAADSSDEAGSADDGISSTDLDGLNPARYCKALRDQMTELESDFAAMFGTNPNHANAFGKCVSRRAHGEDLSGAAGGDDSQGEDNPCETAELPASDGTETGAEDGIDTTASDDEEADDQGSDDEATETEDCSGSDDPADDEQGQDDDEQGEDQGAEDGGTVDEADSSDLGTVLRFLRL